VGALWYITMTVEDFLRRTSGLLKGQHNDGSPPQARSWLLILENGTPGAWNMAAEHRTMGAALAMASTFGCAGYLGCRPGRRRVARTAARTKTC
jgi:hypothetical protein